MWRQVVAAVALGIATLVPSLADGQPRLLEQWRDLRSQQRIVQQWKEALHETDQLLVQNEPKRAYRSATRLLDEMTRRIISGGGAATLLSTALVLRAIAAVQVGERDEGLWHWHVAQQLFPEVADYRLTAYGEAGELLMAHPARQPGESPAASSPEATPPIKKRTPKPRFPEAKRGMEPVTVVVEVIIGTDGRVRGPSIVESRGEPTLVCATFEKLRLWSSSRRGSTGSRSRSSTT